MNDLSPKVNALLELGRLGDNPTQAEIGNNRGALARKLGAAALGASAALGTTKQAAGAASVGTWTTTKVALLCGAVAIGGATTWGVVQYAGGTPHGDVRTMPMQTAVQPTVEVPALAIVEQPESPITPAVTPAASAASMPGTASTSKTAGVSPAPSISDELKLVRGAQQHLNRGEPRAALSLLSEHARRFPSGVLWEEREASRVLALCGLGDREAARALAEEFIRRAPRSPFVDRVRAACREPSPSGSP